MVRRILASFHPRHQPWITRQSYTYEMVTAMTMPIAVALFEGGVIGVLARKAFGVPPLLFATIMAAPMFANLTSLLWAALARGRRKVPFITTLQVMTLLTVASIALLPVSTAGSVLLTALTFLSRCLISGIVTIRSTIWRMNYPRPQRAQVTGRLAILSSLAITVTPLVGYSLLDFNANSFRILYPAGALIAIIGVIAFTRVRLRGERELLRFERSPNAQPHPRGIPGPIYEFDPEEPAEVLHNFWTVLRQDHLFRRYLQWQFVGGMSMMAGETAVVYLIAEDLTKKLQFEYLTAVLLTVAIPSVVAMLTVPVWARYLDRAHVIRFRARQGWFWVLGQAGQWAAAWTASASEHSVGAALVLLGAARVVVGLIRGGGILAWTLGHNDFADRRMVTLYMGIHVTLTGVRGAIAPFLAIILYVGWNPLSIPGTGLALPGFTGMQGHVFGLTTGLAVIALAGFLHLSRSVPRPSERPGAPPPSGPSKP